MEWFKLACFSAIFVATLASDVYLKAGEVHVFKLEPKPTKTELSFSSKPGSTLAVYCDDFRFPNLGEDDPCKYNSLIFDDGVQKQTFCKTNYKMMVKGNTNRLRIDVDLKHGAFIDCVAKTTEEPEAKKIMISPYEESYMIDTSKTKHEQYADLVWKFESVDSRISAICEKSLNDAPCLQRKLIINNGEETKEYCGSDRTVVISKDKKLTVRVNMDKFGDASVRCIVQGITGPHAEQAKNLVSEEVDSREHGVTPGRLSTTCSCGWTNKETQNQRIFHGKETKEGEYPWMVALQRKNQGFHCGGSIITPYHVLTAAHCVLDSQVRKMKNYEPMEVIVGGYQLRKDSSHGQMQTIDVKQPFIKQEWLDFKKHYDISVLLLEKKINYGKYVGPVCLPNPEKPYKLLYTRLKATGWGLTHENIYPDKLKTTRLFVMDKNACPSSDGIICTYSKTSSICYGDSGSPLVHLDPDTNRYTQISVNSFTSIGHCVSSSGSANVSYHFQWLKNIVDSTMPQQLCMKN